MTSCPTLPHFAPLNAAIIHHNDVVYKSNLSDEYYGLRLDLTRCCLLTTIKIRDEGFALFVCQEKQASRFCYGSSFYEELDDGAVFLGVARRAVVSTRSASNSPGRMASFCWL